MDGWGPTDDLGAKQCAKVLTRLQASREATVSTFSTYCIHELPPGTVTITASTVCRLGFGYKLFCVDVLPAETLYLDADLYCNGSAAAEFPFV